MWSSEDSLRHPCISSKYWSSFSISFGFYFLYYSYLSLSGIRSWILLIFHFVHVLCIYNEYTGYFKSSFRILRSFNCGLGLKSYFFNLEAVITVHTGKELVKGVAPEGFVTSCRHVSATDLLIVMKGCTMANCLVYTNSMSTYWLRIWLLYLVNKRRCARIRINCMRKDYRFLSLRDEIPSSVGLEFFSMQKYKMFN